MGTVHHQKKSVTSLLRAQTEVIFVHMCVDL